MTFVERYGPWAAVTGAARGMGAAFAADLVERGLALLLVDRDEQPLTETALELESRGAEVQTLVVDSTLFARVRRDRVVDVSRVRPGQVIVGLASAGRAAYERAENSGIGSNGLTLARQHGLIPTGGSDYHGRSEHGADLGAVFIPPETIDLLEARRASR